MNRSLANIDTIVKANVDAIVSCAEILAYGGLVGIPTETVYGLAGDATNGQAVAAIFEAKGRPSFNPLICHVCHIDMAEKLVVINDTAKLLIERFWPGPLTLVLPAKANNGISELVSADLPSLAVRMPANVTTRAIIEKLGKPIAAPSANISGKLSPTTAEHVAESLQGKVGLILDDGPASDGIESTILHLDGDTVTLLRPGTLTREDIEAALGYPISLTHENTIIAPGMMTSHYAPDAALTLNAATPRDDAFLIGFGAIEGDLNLSPSGDLREAASKLFSSLRQADKSNKNNILIAPIPQEGLGIAINDRLTRAAAPKTQDHK